MAYLFLLSYDNKSKNQTAFQLQKWLLVYKSCISITKVAFRLQIFNCQLQRWPFTLQSGISSLFMSLILRVIKNVFAQAAELKEENDYTI